MDGRVRNIRYAVRARADTGFTLTVGATLSIGTTDIVLEPL